MRTLLPLCSLLSEIVKELKLPPDFKSTISCRVFEDNNGALLLARTKQRITNRTKYFLVKWHFFWHHVTNGNVQVLKIATTNQLANYLTKGLNRETFERIRKLACVGVTIVGLIVCSNFGGSNHRQLCSNSLF